MFIGIGVFALYSYMTKPATADRVYYEANASGKLVKVERPTTQSPPAKRLFKPEPQWLVDHTDALALTPAQVKGIEALGSKWAEAKARFDSSFQSQAKIVSDQGKATASADALRDSLGDYSAMSREYDRQRSAAWLRSVELLSAEQKVKLESLVEAYR